MGMYVFLKILQTTLYYQMLVVFHPINGCNFPISYGFYYISYYKFWGGSVSDVWASAPAPHICSRSQDYGFGSAVAANKEDVKSYLFFWSEQKKKEKNLNKRSNF